MTDNILHVVIVNDFAHINGGASQVAISSAIQLAKLGNDVTFFSSVGPIAPDLISSGVRVILLDQFEIAKDPNRIRAVLQGIWNLKAYKRMVKLLKASDPNNTIFHIHSWTKSLSSSVIRPILKRKHKAVFTFHDYFYACPNGGFYNYQTHSICKKTPLSTGCFFSNCDVRSYRHKLWRLLRQFVQNNFGLLKSRPKNIIAISDFSFSILKPFVPNNSSTYRINNPIEVKCQPWSSSESNTKFAFIGRLSSEKGADIFANASKKLDLNSIFIGDGDLRSEILKIFPQAEITGWVPRDSVINSLANSKALVFPSVLYEGSPLAILEAAAIGIPSIVSDSCAGRDMVLDGITGFWFRSGDDFDLVEKILLMQTAGVATKLSKAAYEHYWKSPATLENHTNNLLSTYSLMMDKSREY
jgi:glycosyltransferase involved in cell wall biosynthesis